jgi:hypothetical protein
MISGRSGFWEKEKVIMNQGPDHKYSQNSKDCNKRAGDILSRK